MNQAAHGYFYVFSPARPGVTKSALVLKFIEEHE
jgi:hypothetical protein